MNQLPIYEVLPQIKQALNQNNKLILEAPAGAGKSTVVPISLINESYLAGKKIIVLEPRRVAARAVAKQMAKLLDEQIGKTVGYQIKNESCYSKDTRVLVITEGILTRKLQKDQSLDGIAMVIFDEFHERSIHTDLGLALCLEAQELLRDDLKILIMSATLNSKGLKELLKDAPIIKSEGRTFPIEDIYLEGDIKHPSLKNLGDLLVSTTLRALKENDGDILVFLPGRKEIIELKKRLDEKLIKEDILILPLYSNLTKEEQDRAIQKQEKRKVVLSTNIAQTSLTIDGLKVVIDSGLEKISKFSHSNNMDHLDYSFICLDSSIQRAGRAGRLSQGKCYKLWHKNRILEESSVPEILRIDLLSSILNLSLWGVNSFEELNFLDRPKEEIVKLAKEELINLEMLDKNFNITPMGEKALDLGVNPRFAHMILKSIELSYEYEACLLTAILEEKDILTSNDKNILTRFFILYEENFNINANSYRARSILKQAKSYYKRLKPNEIVNKKICDENILAVLLLYAYPSRLAKQRQEGDNRYKLSSAKGAVLNKEDNLSKNEYLVVCELSAKKSDSYINLASTIKLSYIKEYFSNTIQKENYLTYNKQNQTIENRVVTKFLKLELETKPSKEISRESLNSFILNLLKEEGFELLNFTKNCKELISRVNFVNKNYKNSTFIDLSNGALLDSLDVWLLPYLDSVNNIKDLKNLDIYNILLALIPWEQQQLLDELVPIVYKVPSGSKIKIDYSDENIASLKVKIQELFGLKQTPKILNNSYELQLHLLSPALRPIQITYDIESFWQNSYDEVKKELKGKYKKHYWPDNPYEAIATNKTKKHMK